MLPDEAATSLPAVPTRETTLALDAAIHAPPSVEAVRRMEALLLTLPQVDLGTENVVHGGMCARTIMVPAGVALTGALTKIDNICVMCGDIEVTTDQGPRRMTGFHVLTAKAGFKRGGRAYADTYWTTIWRTDLKDVEAIEDEMTDEAANLQTRRFKTLPEVA